MRLDLELSRTEKPTHNEDAVDVRTSFLEESGFQLIHKTAGQNPSTEDLRPTSIIPALPMPGDKTYDGGGPSTVDSPKVKEAPKVEEPIHHHKKEAEDELSGFDPRIVSQPSEWLKPKNFLNPFNPLRW